MQLETIYILQHLNNHKLKEEKNWLPIIKKLKKKYFT